MTDAEPPIAEANYIAWAAENGVANFSEATELSYRQNVAYVFSTVQADPYFSGLRAFLEQCYQEYFATTGAELFMGEPNILLVQKSYASMVNKSYRHNVVTNTRFPRPPRKGWLTPDNWFDELNDVIRGRITCKFIDGPRFLAERFYARSQELQLESHYTSQQRDDGYYAYHFYVKIPVTMLDANRNISTTNVSVELQVNTQLQEILYKITHRYYESLRNRRQDESSTWKWEVGSSRFRVGYLSHTLHLLEGIILELRDSGTDMQVNPMEPDEHE